MPSAVITGGNKGLGYRIARQLLWEEYEIVLACRDPAKATAAGNALIADRDPARKRMRVRHVLLDLEHEDTFAPAAEETAKLYPNGVDVIIHNVGIGVHDSDLATPKEELAEYITKINYFNTRKAFEALLPTLRDGGRIVVMSSRSGVLHFVPSEQQRQRFVAEGLTPNGIDRLLREYIDACGGDEQSMKEAGWPHTEGSYGMSKVSLNAYVRVIAEDLYQKRGITVNCCCPGRSVTDMTDEKAPRTADEGADTAVWLATTDELGDATGRFYAERHEWDWENMSFAEAEHLAVQPYPKHISVRVEKAVHQAEREAEKAKATASG
jgi:carbonyl reductase 1